MLARSKTVALLAALTAVVIGTSAQANPTPRPKRRPAKKVTPPPVPVEPAPDASASGDSEKPDPVAPTPAPGTAPQPAAFQAQPGGPPAPSAPEPSVSAVGEPPDVDNLRQEYLSLRDELFKSRARSNAVASQLYSTRIQIKLTYTTARYYSPAKASIRLDGANVYEDATGAIATDDGIRFDGYIAPGRHLITFRVEATGKDDDSFTSATESQIVVKAVAGKDLIVAAKARDSGDIAYEWKRSEKGSYGLGIDVAVRTAKPAETAAAPAKGAAK